MTWLAGVRVLELASEPAAHAGKLLAELGADVVVVEPPGGHASRSHGPFVDDVEDPEGSLWWWHYNSSKRSVTIDLAEEGPRFAGLVAEADIVLEAEVPGALAALGLDHPDLAPRCPGMIWVSVTPFGRAGPRSDEPATDLTIQANGGMVWSCGYDDHTVPPVRPGGNQAFHTGSLFAVMGALTALVHRDAGGGGQLVDVSLNAAANVVTEGGTFEWLVRQQTVQRQTGRHAWVHPTTEATAVAADGREVTTGVPPTRGAGYVVLRDWLEELDLLDSFDDAIFLELGAAREALYPWDLGVDPEVTEIFAAARSALVLIAENMDSYDFFAEGQRRGLTSGVVYAPEEVLDDPHFVDRGFAVTVDHERLGRSVTYPGAPFRSSRGAYQVRRAPFVGEHGDLPDPWG